MEKIDIYFITSYTIEMFDDYSIFINGKSQNEFPGFKISNKKVFINNINLDEIKKEEGINIKIKNDDGKKNLYKVKLNLEKEEIKSDIFLFQYNLEEISKDINFINWDSIYFWIGNEKYINQIDYSPSQKFSFFYQYLLSRNDLTNFKKSSKVLIQAFFERR